MADESMNLAMLVGLEGSVNALPPDGVDGAKTAIAKALEEGAGTGRWALAAGAVLNQIATQLQMPLANVLKEGWKQDTMLREQLASGGGKPAPSGQVALHDHKVTAVLRPTAQVLMNGQQGPTIEFLVRATLTFKAAFLVVKSATITAIKGGEVAAKCEVFYVSRRGGKQTEYPVMRSREKVFKADRELLLPAGGLRIV
jgi:hypothetical protein